MAEGADSLLDRHRADRTNQVETWGHEIRAVETALDRVLEALRARPRSVFNVDRVGERERITFTTRIPLEEHVLAGLDKDPFVAEELRRRYRAAGFDDMGIDWESETATFTVYDDSAEKPEERAMRLLAEALREAQGR